MIRVLDAWVYVRAPLLRSDRQEHIGVGEACGDPTGVWWRGAYG
jgi:hypothetical protein